MKVTIEVDFRRCGENELAWIAKMAADQEALKLLAKSKVDGIRCNVADNWHTSADLLDELAKDSSPYVRATVADNKKTRLATLKMLASDEVSFVKDAAKDMLEWRKK